MMTIALLAVHLSDGVVANSWAAGGFVVAGAFAFAGAWRIRDEEIPQVALLTAAFFVASLIPIPSLAGSHVHLLLNGMMGVVLGRRAGLAIPLALALQAALFQHGGFTALGINSCVMGIPALLAALVFAGLRRVPWVCHRGFRAGLVMLSVSILLICLAYSIVLVTSNPIAHVDSLQTNMADLYTFHPATLLVILSLGGLAAWAESRLENAPEFPLGFLIGSLSVLATGVLHAVVLLWGVVRPADMHTLALLTFIGELPLALVEGVILGFMVGFLARVKPEMLGMKGPESPECAVSA